MSGLSLSDGLNELSMNFHSSSTGQTQALAEKEKIDSKVDSLKDATLNRSLNRSSLSSRSTISRGSLKSRPKLPSFDVVLDVRSNPNTADSRSMESPSTIKISDDLINSPSRTASGDIKSTDQGSSGLVVSITSSFALSRTDSSHPFKSCNVSFSSSDSYIMPDAISSPGQDALSRRKNSSSSQSRKSRKIPASPDARTDARSRSNSPLSSIVVGLEEQKNILLVYKKLVCIYECLVDDLYSPDIELHLSLNEKGFFQRTRKQSEHLPEELEKEIITNFLFALKNQITQIIDESGKITCLRMVIKLAKTKFHFTDQKELDQLLTQKIPLKNGATFISEIDFKANLMHLVLPSTENIQKLSFNQKYCLAIFQRFYPNNRPRVVAKISFKKQKKPLTQTNLEKINKIPDFVELTKNQRVKFLKHVQLNLSDKFDEIEMKELITLIKTFQEPASLRSFVVNSKTYNFLLPFTVDPKEFLMTYINIIPTSNLFQLIEMVLLWPETHMPKQQKLLVLNFIKNYLKSFFFQGEYCNHLKALYKILAIAQSNFPLICFEIQEILHQLTPLKKTQSGKLRLESFFEKFIIGEANEDYKEIVEKIAKDLTILTAESISFSTLDDLSNTTTIYKKYIKDVSRYFTDFFEIIMPPDASIRCLSNPKIQLKFKTIYEFLFRLIDLLVKNGDCLTSHVILEGLISSPICNFIKCAKPIGIKSGSSKTTNEKSHFYVENESWELEQKYNKIFDKANNYECLKHYLNNLNNGENITISIFTMDKFLSQLTEYPLNLNQEIRKDQMEINFGLLQKKGIFLLKYQSKFENILKFYKKSPSQETNIKTCLLARAMAQEPLTMLKLYDDPVVNSLPFNSKLCLALFQRFDRDRPLIDRLKVPLTYDFLIPSIFSPDAFRMVYRELVPSSTLFRLIEMALTWPETHMPKMQKKHLLNMTSELVFSFFFYQSNAENKEALKKIAKAGRNYFPLLCHEIEEALAQHTPLNPCVTGDFDLSHFFKTIISSGINLNYEATVELIARDLKALAAESIALSTLADFSSDKPSPFKKYQEDVSKYFAGLFELIKPLTESPISILKDKNIQLKFKNVYTFIFDLINALVEINDYFSSQMICIGLSLNSISSFINCVKPISKMISMTKLSSKPHFFVEQRTWDLSQKYKELFDPSHNFENLKISMEDLVQNKKEFIPSAFLIGRYIFSKNEHRNQITDSTTEEEIKDKSRIIDLEFLHHHGTFLLKFEAQLNNALNYYQNNTRQKTNIKRYLEASFDGLKNSSSRILNTIHNTSSSS